MGGGHITSDVRLQVMCKIWSEILENILSNQQALIAAKDQQISDLKLNVEESKKSMEKLEVDKMKLSSTLSAVTVSIHPIRAGHI